MTTIPLTKSYQLITSAVGMMQFNVNNVAHVIVGDATQPADTAAAKFRFSNLEFFTSNAAVKVWAKSDDGFGEVVVYNG